MSAFREWRFTGVVERSGPAASQIRTSRAFQAHFYGSGAKRSKCRAAKIEDVSRPIGTNPDPAAPSMGTIPELGLLPIDWRQVGGRSELDGEQSFVGIGEKCPASEPESAEP